MDHFSCPGLISGRLDDHPESARVLKCHFSYFPSAKSQCFSWVHLFFMMGAVVQEYACCIIAYNIDHGLPLWSLGWASGKDWDSDACVLLSIKALLTIFSFLLQATHSQLNEVRQELWFSYRYSSSTTVFQTELRQAKVQRSNRVYVHSRQFSSFSSLQLA